MNSKELAIASLCVLALFSDTYAKVRGANTVGRRVSLTNPTERHPLKESTASEDAESALLARKSAAMSKRLSRLSTDERASDRKIKIASSNYESVMKNSDVLNEIQSLDMHRSNLSAEQISEILAKCNPEKLKILNLDDNNLETIPREVFAFSKLRWLKLARNRLTQIPGEIGNLTQLTILKLDHNRIQDLPDTLKNLNGILQLYLEYNKIKKFPTIIASLKSLKVLHLEGNVLKNILKELPKDIGEKLVDLRSIFLMKNKILTDDQKKLRKLFDADKVRVFF